MPSKPHDLVDFTKKYKGELSEFYLDLKSWRKFKSRYRLSWEKVRFDETARSDIPTARGIYAFTVELAPSKLPTHSYIMYVGITGDRSGATLRSRYSQYLGEQRGKRGRPAVIYMLQNWSDDLFFNYATFESANVDLGKMERDMLNAIIPPVNKRDLGATVSGARAAAF